MAPKTAKIDQRSLQILSECEFDGERAILTSQLSRPEYVAVNKILELLGGKWDKKAKAHVFAGLDAEDRVNDAILSGEVEKPEKSLLDFFPTPRYLAERVVELAEISNDDFVLEPSAGDGALVAEIVNCDPKKVWALEIDNDRRYETAKRFAHLENVVVEQANFLSMQSIDDSKITRIVMNPPFSKKQDVLHVCKAYEHLADNGILVAIVSAGVTFRNDTLTKHFRNRILELGGEIIPIESGAFKQSGTMVATAVVKITKTPNTSL